MRLIAGIFLRNVVRKKYRKAAYTGDSRKKVAYTEVSLKNKSVPGYFLLLTHPDFSFHIYAKRYLSCQEHTHSPISLDHRYYKYLPPEFVEGKEVKFEKVRSSVFDGISLY